MVNTDLTPRPLTSELELATFLFNIIESQITRADTKAGPVVAADVVFVTALLLVSRGTLLHLFDAGAGRLACLSAVITLLVCVALVCSTLFALCAARPT